MAAGWGATRALLGAALAGFCVLSAWNVQAQVQTAEYWRKYQAMLTDKGLLRAERDPVDVTYSKEDLVRDFRAIMLTREYAKKAGDFVKNAAPRRLKKLDSVVRIDIRGKTITDTDMKHIRDFMDRLNRVTGVRMVESEEDPMIRLMILTREERLAFARHAARSPRWDFIAKNVANDLGSAVCGTYYSRDRQDRNRIDYIIVIPAEVTGILRRSCIEEELGQTFGPGADFDGARPSIFNDDAEFALLTRHDEDLLRILYDPRLEPGMTVEEAMPVVRRIVGEMRPGM
ncbi:MAG TPA: DUF2927 domain-containing protein [Paracoccaceae bacterium]|nr:DUF2927 domain-containing protein [Paracoccaceae bacterium]